MSLLDVRELARPPLLDARDLALERGEIVVVRGPSGSGKSLFLRAIADLDPHEAVSVRLDGRAREDFEPAAWRAAVRYVHPGGVRLPGTVRENVERVARLAVHAGGVAADLPSVAGVEDGRDARSLSGGEAQELALVRALLAAPRVLLLDEATAAMDPDRARGWERRLAEWVGAGDRALLWVAHDEALAGRLGARVERFA